MRVWLTPVDTPESPPDLAGGCLRLPAVVLAEMEEGDRKLADLTAQDVEEALKAVRIRLMRWDAPSRTSRAKWKPPSRESD